MSLVLATTAAAEPRLPVPPAAWADGPSIGWTFLDLSAQPMALVPSGEAQAFSLPEPVAFRGLLFDTLVVGPEPGTARLAWHGEGTAPAVVRGDGEPVPPSPSSLLLQPLGTELAFGPRGTTQLRSDGRSVAVRFTDLRDAFDQRATFEILVAPDGFVAYQYLQVPPSVRSRPEDAGILLVEESRGERVEPAREGFAAAAGAVVVFPPEVPWDPMQGCGVARPWCDVIRAYDTGCLSQPPTHADATPCATTEARRWHFNENQYCRSCPYVFYVTVECGKAMHLPFKDMEGNQVRIIDVFTGVELELNASNECARTPFQYCDRCPGAIDRPPDCAGGVGPPFLDCVPWTQRSTLIQWGLPFRDLDGDGVAAELPCGPANQSSGCGQSGGNPAFEEQSTDIVLDGSPALCGVFRLEIVSGGWHWYLSANCTGIVPETQAEIDQNFLVYQNCGDALAAFDPITELIVTKFEFTGTCPDIMLDVEVANIGCVDAPSSPILITFAGGGNTDVRDDLGAVPAGGAVSKRIPYSLRNPPVVATLMVDPGNQVPECTEQPALSFNGCDPEPGTESITTTLCLCANTVQAAVSANRVYACGGQTVTVDALPSSAVPCTGGRLEWQFLDASGGIARDWLDDSTFDVTPSRCPSVETYTVQARCSLETAVDCVDRIPVTVECVNAPPLDVVASPLQICAGDSVVLTASSGFLSYQWGHGRTGRSILETPAVTTTYDVTGTDIRGCTSQGRVTVTVIPDPVPLSIGATLRAQKSGRNVGFSYQELLTPVADYQLLCHAPAGPRPCASFRPSDPMPQVIDAALPVALAPPGTPQPALVHRNALDECPNLLFYKVFATSPCTRQRGPTCDGEPMQFPPCP